VSYGSEFHLLTQVGFGVIISLDFLSVDMGFDCRVSYDFRPCHSIKEGLSAVMYLTISNGPSDLIYKEMLSWPAYVVRYVCVQGATACFQGV
jgi:hypothetical protein